MSVIATIEDAITAELTTALGHHVRDLGSLPGPWSNNLLRRLFQKSPACYISWLGGPVERNQVDRINARIDVLLVTKNARGEAARRRGDQRHVGAYDLVEVAVPALNGHVIDDVGTLSLNEIRNVFNEATFDVGATVYALAFTLPMDLSTTVDPGALDDFLEYREDVDMAPADGDIDMHTNVDLPAV